MGASSSYMTAGKPAAHATGHRAPSLFAGFLGLGRRFLIRAQDRLFDELGIFLLGTPGSSLMALTSALSG